MTVTKIISENEENIKSAVNDGISGEAVESTLEDIINKSNELNKTPKQVKDTVEAIVEMKNNTQNQVDESYASNFVKENNKKIESALETGITPKEVTETLIKSTDNSNTRKDRKHLKFIVNLISKMKNKELKLNKNKDKGYQKTYSDK